MSEFKERIEQLRDAGYDWKVMVSEDEIVEFACKNFDKLVREFTEGEYSELAFQLLLSAFLREDTIRLRSAQVKLLYESRAFLEKYYNILVDQVEAYPENSIYITPEHMLDMQGSDVWVNALNQSECAKNNWMRIFHEKS